LRIAGLRNDGYHLLDAEMITLDLADSLEVSDGDGLDVVDAVDWVGEVRDAPGEPLEPGEGAPGGGGAGSLARRNLVRSALEVAGRHAHVRLTKRIPAGAGLGGGSADAAAILRWARCDDLRVAAGLGADVPFCLVGGRARVTGIGEEVAPLPPEHRLVLLVVPHLVVPTPAVYRAWDELGGPRGDYGNDLEPAALAVVPQLRWWRDLMGAAIGERPRLAGSGGTWFVERGPAERDTLAALAGQIKAEIVAGREGALVRLAETTV
jgi:4-diphosphocytidyl-2-C-methyl-D-erythritol kinase